ncbi:MAG: hypothetical protein JXD23_13730 [Spirochaetales bacterium]|nr:hypothetical protein [Spirochaetales bacterium]
MAFSTRISLLNLFFIFGLCLVAGFCVNAAVCLVFGANGLHPAFLESEPFWFVYTITPFGETSSVAGMGLLAVVGIVGFVLYRTFFRTTGQGELFFLSLFLFSLLPETLRLAIFNLQLWHASPLIGVILSRIVFGSRMFGLLSLLFGSLYALDFQYQKYGIVVAAMILVSFLLTFSLPFDPQLLLTSGMFKLNDELGVFILYVSLAALLIVNNIISVARGRAFLTFAGILAMLLAREMTIFALSPLPLVGGGVLFAGGAAAAYFGYKSQFTLT